MENIDDRNVYDTNVRSMLHSRTGYRLRKKKKKQIEDGKFSWSQAYIAYFETSMYKKIVDYSDRRISEQNDELYNPYLGMTNGTIENINSKLKCLISCEKKVSIKLFCIFITCKERKK